MIAAARRDEVHVYSVPEIGANGGAKAGGGLSDVAPIKRLKLPRSPGDGQGAPSIRSIGWCQAEGSEGSLLVLTEANVLLLGRIGSREGLARVVADDVTVMAAAWSPDAACFAYIDGGRALVLADSDGTELGRVRICHPDGESGGLDAWDL